MILEKNCWCLTMVQTSRFTRADGNDDVIIPKSKSSITKYVWKYWTKISCESIIRITVSWITISILLGAHFSIILVLKRGLRRMIVIFGGYKGMLNFPRVWRTQRKQRQYRVGWGIIKRPSIEGSKTGTCWTRYFVIISFRVVIVIT